MGAFLILAHRSPHMNASAVWGIGRHFVDLCVSAKSKIQVIGAGDVIRKVSGDRLSMSGSAFRVGK